MNPFLHDPVAKPLISRPVGSWQFPFSNHSCPRLKHHVGVVAIAAGLGVSLSAHAIDVNTASAAELERVRGVGPRTAQIIVQERLRAGHFASLDDLSDRVRGIGRKRLETLQAAGLLVAGPGRAGHSVSAAGSESRKGAVRRSPPEAAATPLITMTEPML
jgi:competence protein ComEA